MASPNAFQKMEASFMNIMLSRTVESTDGEISKKWISHSVLVILNIN